MQTTGKRHLLPLCAVLAAASACGGQAAGPSIDEEIDACYSHTPLDAIPQSDPDFEKSPAAAAEGFAGTFRSAAGDELTVKWDGSIDEVRWECDDRDDLPQTAGGATAEFQMPVDLKLVTRDGDFDESIEDTLVVRVDGSSPTEETTQVGTGDNLEPQELVGDFAPPSDQTLARVHWSASYEGDGWTVKLSAYGLGGGDLMPFWTRELRFTHRTRE